MPPDQTPEDRLMANEHRCAAGYKLPANGAKCVVCGAGLGGTCGIWVQRMTTAERVVAEQAADERLWFRPVYITEDYLQKELRRLHAAIEGKSPDECATEALRAALPASDGALPPTIKEPERLTTPDGRLLTEAPAVANVGHSPASDGARAVAERIVREWWSAHVWDNSWTMRQSAPGALERAIATALTTARAEGWDAGREAAALVAEGMPTVWNGVVSKLHGEDIAAAIRALQPPAMPEGEQP